MTRRHVLPLGSVSTGTLRAQDLLEAFLWEAERLQLTRAERATARGIRRRYDAADEDSAYWDDESADDVQELTQILESHCPDYCYFGSHPGDGADFGGLGDRRAVL
jgi:hypothetical protein